MKMKLFVLMLIACSAQLNAQVKKVKHIVLIGIDGLGAKAIPDGSMPELKKLMGAGSWTLKARSVLPSSSAVNWASALMGSGPTQHGYTEWGSKTPEIPSAVTTKYGMYPGIFSAIRDQKPNAKTAVIYSWSGIKYLFENDAVTTVIDGKGKDDICTDTAASIIKKEKPLLTFIHLSEPDNQLHGVGFMTDVYNERLKIVDKRIGRLVQAVKDAGIDKETVFLIIADHGGLGKDHGGKTLGEVLIPWVISGAGVKANNEIKDEVIIYDTAATLAWIIGLKEPQSWRGKPIISVFK
jgi:predicted AlkP superfamily pyrophosphatase or phosphodiesterase